MEEGAAPWLDLTVDQLIVRRWGGRVTPAVWHTLIQLVFELGLSGRVVGELTDWEVLHLAQAFKNARDTVAYQREAAALQAEAAEQRARWVDVLQRSARQQARARSAKPDPVHHPTGVKGKRPPPQPKTPLRQPGRIRRPSRWQPGT